MKTLLLATTALSIGIASAAFAADNQQYVYQTPVGAGVPVANLAQGYNNGTDQFAMVVQVGDNRFDGVQLDSGTKLVAYQENTTGGTANTIGYTGRGNSDTTIYQRASNGNFTTSGASGNSASVDMPANLPGGISNKLFLDQVGFNNKAIVYSSWAGSASNTNRVNNFRITQMSPNANSGNELQIIAPNFASVNVFQKGGNKANIGINSGGSQTVNLTQENTANNISSANIANLDIRGALVNWSQTGTNNVLDASLKGRSANYGLAGWQSGDGNVAQVVQNVSYQDLATGANQLYQLGTNNFANARQTSTHNSRFDIGQSGTSNTAFVSQSSNDNRALIQQGGNNNQANIVQTGTGSVAKIFQSTNNNVAAIVQNGNGMNMTISQ